MIYDEEFWSIYNFKLANYVDDLNTFFASIDIPEYEDRSDNFYIDNHVFIEKLNYTISKSPLERFNKYLLFAGWEFTHLKNIEIQTNNNFDDKINYINNAKILLLLHETPVEKINLSLNSNLSSHITKDLNIINSLKINLEESFTSLDINDPNYFKNITKDKLENIIETNKKEISKKGAPLRKKNIAQFAELLMFLIYSENEISYKVDKFSNKDCTLVYNYLDFWGLIEKKTRKARSLIKSNVSSTIKTSTPHNYIRSLIKNLRNQRIKSNVKLHF